MSTEEKLDELFYSIGRTKKVEFIDKYINEMSKQEIPLDDPRVTV